MRRVRDGGRIVPLSRAGQSASSIALLSASKRSPTLVAKLRPTRFEHRGWHSRFSDYCRGGADVARDCLQKNETDWVGRLAVMLRVLVRQLRNSVKQNLVDRMLFCVALLLPSAGDGEGTPRLRPAKLPRVLSF